MMEYKLLPFNDGFHTYRHRQSGEKIMLAPNGLRCDGQGYVDGIGNCFDEANSWTTQLEHQQANIIGHRVCPTGKVCHDRIKLPTNQWECMLKDGSTIIDTHIPPGAALIYSLA